jgi:hypothetical protein
MTHLRTAFRLFSLLVFLLAVSSAAHAQATRTWVSGVGDDVNPCSRTAPCKTFAGAISKTFIGGEIDALDDGGYGTVTITKSITIDGGGHLASVLASGTNGINVNFTAAANANDPQRRVTLRRLSINGTGASGAVGTSTGLKGINISTNNANLAVHVENCYIQNFTQVGIDTSGVAATGVYLSVKDTNIQNTQVGVNITTSTGFIQANLDHARIEKNAGNGVTVGVHGHVYVRESEIIFNSDGISMAAGVTDGTAHVESTFVGSNTVGIRNGGTGSIVDISNTSIIENGTGLATSSGAAGGGINSHGNNQIANTGTPGTAPNGIGQQ